MKALGIALVTVLLALPAMAQPANSPSALTFKDYKTTADYVRDCAGPTVSQMGCMVALGLVQNVPGHPTFCAPDTSSRDPQEGKKQYTALIITLVDWLKQRPEYLNRPYAEGLSAALLGRYPCNSITQVACTLPSVRPAPLSREQQAAFQLEAPELTKNMSPDQVRAWRQEQVCDLVAMSEAERNGLRDRLQARWDALPAAEKAQLLRPRIPVSQRPQNQR